MTPFLEAFLSELEGQHAAIERALLDLPPEALDWVPAPGANSLGVLAVHVAGSERHWIGEIAGQEPAQRDRAAEFRSRGLDNATLRQRLADTLAHSRSVIARLTDADLALVRATHHNQETHTVAWALLHSLAHTAEHKGHMELTRQLWEHQQR